MISKEFEQYTNPVFLDTDGPNYIRTRYAVDKTTGEVKIPKTEVLFEVVSDGRAPITQISSLRAHGGVRIHGPQLTDFAETAALACALDMIVTADTSLAHLAGALGLELIVLAQHIQDVRWPLNRQSSPWYPAARVLRARSDHGWTDALYAVKRTLSVRASA